MKVIRETIVAGRTIIQSVKASTRLAGKEGKRAPHKNPTPEAVQKVNGRLAEKDLTIKLNHNFVPGDWHLILTYDTKYGKVLPLPTPTEAKKHKEQFFRKLKGSMAKENIVLKRIDVTEYKHTRIHHHVVCNNFPLEKIAALWPHGSVRTKLPGLDDSGNYYKLAAYLIKETKESFRQEDSPTKRRYNCSRSIVTPVPNKEIVSDRLLLKDPVAPKGYYIDQDTVRRYEHAITGADCLEYIMVSLDETPRLKRWGKGKKVKRKEYYKIPDEKQLSLIV